METTTTEHWEIQWLEHAPQFLPHLLPHREPIWRVYDKKTSREGALTELAELERIAPDTDWRFAHVKTTITYGERPK